MAHNLFQQVAGTIAKQSITDIFILSLILYPTAVDKEKTNITESVGLILKFRSLGALHKRYYSSISK